jgi:lysophospholipase L1-like esterase
MALAQRSIFSRGRFFVVAALSVGLVGAALAQPGGGRGGRGGFFGNPTGEAQVPEAVAMPCPGPDELTRARELLAEFRGDLAADDRALLDRYPRMLEVTTPVNTAIVPNLAQFFRGKHEQNLAVARAGGIELLLMGDSITDFWRNETGNFAGKPVLDEYFGHWKIANFGIAGDTTQGVLYRLQNGEGEGFSPRAVMLMIGTNNTGRNTAAEIAEGVGAVVLELENRFPEAQILLLGIFPRSAPDNPVRETLDEINGIISRLDDGETVHYLDIGDVFLDAEGNIPESVMSDALHPSTEGYRRWAEAVQAPLTDLMAE